MASGPYYRKVLYERPYPVKKFAGYNCGSCATLPLHSVTDGQHKVKPIDGVLSKDAAAVHHQQTGIDEDTCLLVVLDSSKHLPYKLQVEELVNFYKGLATKRRPVIILHVGAYQCTPDLAKDRPAAFLHAEHLDMSYLCEWLDYHIDECSRVDIALKEISEELPTSMVSSLWHRFCFQDTGLDGPRHLTSSFGDKPIRLENMSDELKSYLERIPGLTSYQVTGSCELAVRCDPCHKEQAQPSIERLCKAFKNFAGVVSWEQKIKVISTDRWYLGVSEGKGPTDTLSCSLGVLVEADGQPALLISCHPLLDHLEEDAEVKKARKRNRGSETWIIEVHFKSGRRFVAGRHGDPTPAVPLGTRAIGVVTFLTDTLNIGDVTGDMALIYLNDPGAPEAVDNGIYLDDPDASKTKGNGNPIKIARPSDVRRLPANDFVYSCGQNTGRTKGHIINRGSFGIETKFLSNMYLRDLVSVRSETGYFSEKGDSGSPVWAEVRGECTLVGTVTGVKRDSRETFFLLIHNQLELFDRQFGLTVKLVT